MKPRQPRIVKIGFSRPKGWFKPLSWGIRMFEGHTKYSHVYIRWTSNAAKTDIVYEASGNALKFYSHPIWEKKNRTVEEFDFLVERDGYKRLLQLAMSNAGVDYGKKQILGILLVRLFRLSKNPFADGRKSQVCSEIVGRFLTEVMAYDTELDLDVAGPKDIYNYLKSRK